MNTDESIDEVYARVYDELLVLARRVKRAKGHLAATESLVHELYLRLRRGSLDVDGRKQFFALAAKAMRNILTDRARAAVTRKRGRGQALPLADHHSARGFDLDPASVLSLYEALDGLRLVHERAASVAEGRFILGESVEEAAERLGVGPRTVEYDWQFARAWLGRALRDAEPPRASP